MLRTDTSGHCLADWPGPLLLHRERGQWLRKQSRQVPRKQRGTQSGEGHRNDLGTRTKVKGHTESP